MGTLYQNGNRIFNVAPVKNTYVNDPNSAASAKTVYDLKQFANELTYTVLSTITEE